MAPTGLARSSTPRMSRRAVLEKRAVAHEEVARLPELAVTGS